MADAAYDVLREPPDEPVIRWMDAAPTTFSTTALATATITAFALGAAATLAAMIIGRLLQGEDEEYEG